MGLLLEALVSIGLIVGVIWLVSLYRSAAADRASAAQADAEEKRQAELDAALHRPGESLHCLNCDTIFTGPLPEDGCPNCHLSTLVAPEADFRRNGSNLRDANR